MYGLSIFFNFLDIFVVTGVLVVLDAHPEGIIYRDLIPEYVNIARTLYEGLTFAFGSLDISASNF